MSFITRLAAAAILSLSTTAHATAQEGTLNISVGFISSDPIPDPRAGYNGWMSNQTGVTESCRSRKLSTLRRNFPEADIRAGAQHFATLDDCNADFVTVCDTNSSDCFQTWSSLNSRNQVVSAPPEFNLIARSTFVLFGGITFS